MPKNSARAATSDFVVRDERSGELVALTRARGVAPLFDVALLAHRHGAQLPPHGVGCRIMKINPFAYHLWQRFWAIASPYWRGDERNPIEAVNAAFAAALDAGGRGTVMALYPLLPNKMMVNRTDQGILYYQYEKDGQTYFLSQQDVLHIPGLGFDGLVGYSPIAMAKNAIGMGLA